MQAITQNKKRIKVQHIVGAGTAQIDVVRNIQLPVRARKIVDIHTEIVELDYEIIPNKVIVKGALHKQVYYVEEGDYVVKEFTVMREEFTDFVHIDGARPDMEALLDGHILIVNICYKHRQISIFLSSEDGSFRFITIVHRFN